MDRPTRRRALAFILLAGITLAPARVALTQQAAIFHVYDDLNRLSAVVNQQGDVAVYTYDATGNILRIERFDASGLPGAVGISYFTPQVGPAGTPVQVFGKGFGPTPGQNTLTFNGTPAVITIAAPNRLLVSVPAGATTGPIAVTTPLGSAASATPFRVVGTLALTPTVTEVQVGLAHQFEVTENGAPTANVRWSVNGVVGGEAGVGTISTGGLYTAPAAIPVPPTVTITVTHQDDPSISASARATILAAGPRFGTAAAVSVAFAGAPPVVDRSVTGTVSVQFAAPPATALAATPALSVAVAPPAAAVQATSALVSVGIEPVVTALAPAAVAAGSSFTLTITGVGLAETSGINFLRNNVADAAITASNVTSSGDGTVVTADVTIAAGATPGGRVIQVTAPGAASTAAPTGGNVFTVQ